MAESPNVYRQDGIFSGESLPTVLIRTFLYCAGFLIPAYLLGSFLLASMPDPPSSVRSDTTTIGILTGLLAVVWSYAHQWRGNHREDHPLVSSLIYPVLGLATTYDVLAWICCPIVAISVHYPSGPIDLGGVSGAFATVCDAW